MFAESPAAMIARAPSRSRTPPVNVLFSNPAPSDTVPAPVNVRPPSGVSPRSGSGSNACRTSSQYAVGPASSAWCEKSKVSPPAPR